MANSLLNKKAVKTFALSIGQERYHKFTRVSAELFVEVESVVREYLKRKIESLPSVGKTIK